MNNPLTQPRKSFFTTGAVTDPIYCDMRDGRELHHARGRMYLERLWQMYAQYVDGDAADRATRDLVAVCWELHLVHALIHAGKRLTPRQQLGYKNNKGPDLFVEDAPGVWVEAVAVRSGDGPDKLEPPEPMKVLSYNPDGVVLRLRSVIQAKIEKIGDTSPMES